MRDCPHCSEPIQEEATFCKHCHQEVEPPLWVNSMRRCPYCAEWIDLEHENCQYCGKHVGTVDLTESSAFIESLLNDDFLEDLPQTERASGGASPFIQEDPPADQAERDLPASEPSELERELSFLTEEPFEEEPELDAFQPEAARPARQSPFTADAFAEFSSELPIAEGELDDFSFESSRPESDLAAEPLSEEDEPEQAPSFLERDPADFSQSLRRSLIEPEADQVDDYQEEGEPEIGPEAELEQEPEFTPDQPYDRELAYGQLSAYESDPAEETESAYEFESEAERRARISTSAGSAEPEFVSVPSSESESELHGSIWTSEVGGISDLRVEAAAPRTAAAKLPAGVLQGVLGLALIGGLAYGLVALASGPAGALLAEALATDVPTETPIPQPTATRSVAPTLPPETPLAVEPTAGPEGEVPECLLWDQVSLDDEGRELCVYGVIRRWFAVDDVPFVAIFSEELGTFAIVDRTTTHPVESGDCIVARGVVEVMSRTRPDIDLNGTLELCPAEWLGDG